VLARHASQADADRRASTRLMKLWMPKSQAHVSFGRLCAPRVCGQRSAHR
jgi:hypothetical protein